MSAYFQPVTGGALASRVGTPVSFVKQAGLVGSAVRGVKSFGHSRLWLAALLCMAVTLGAGGAAAVEFSPLNIGSVELVAGASHSELRDVAQASTNYTDSSVSAEKKAREEADSALVGSLSELSDALTAETKSRIDADTGNAKAVDDEATARENADKTLQENISAVSSDLSTHVSMKSGNPHGVTAAQVGVSLADATSVVTNGEEVVTNVVADVKRLTVDEASADIATQDYVDAATSEAVKPILSNTNVTFRIDGKDLLIVGTNNTTIWNSYYAPNAGASASSASEKKYPLFIIRLNEDAASPKFSDIELKATTNNYATFESMTFFAGTAVNGLDSSDYGFTPDWCRIYILSSKVDGDVRRWRRIRNTTDLGEYKPGDFAIIVDPAMFRRGQGDGWCSDQNEELTWSFVRLGSGAEDDAEKDADGTSQLWRPIMPVKWYSKLPAWADQDEYGAGN